MTSDEFDAFCAGLPATEMVVQWGGSHVWKVGSKVFAVMGWADDGPGFTFKTGEIGFEVLKDMPGLRPAPYLASRGLKWIQHYEEPGLSDAELAEHVRASYDMIVAKLSKPRRRALGLNAET